MDTMTVVTFDLAERSLPRPAAPAFAPIQGTGVRAAGGLGRRLRGRTPSTEPDSHPGACLV
ncbi:hypothetical protein [Actinotalea sp. JY-7876]|uniref:hypothetical protein n=1 Tax=Actinotalea sp. JY-7876 TaxID=2758442 RepID=UPI0015F74719|nr:hypothetical protein [Actinotalea sp. JY-7876]